MSRKQQEISILFYRSQGQEKVEVPGATIKALFKAPGFKPIEWHGPKTQATRTVYVNGQPQKQFVDSNIENRIKAVEYQRSGFDVLKSFFSRVTSIGNDAYPVKNDSYLIAQSTTDPHSARLINPYKARSYTEWYLESNKQPNFRLYYCTGTELKKLQRGDGKYKNFDFVLEKDLIDTWLHAVMANLVWHSSAIWFHGKDISQAGEGIFDYLHHSFLLFPPAAGLISGAIELAMSTWRYYSIHHKLPSAEIFKGLVKHAFMTAIKTTMIVAGFELGLFLAQHLIASGFIFMNLPSVLVIGLITGLFQGAFMVFAEAFSHANLKKNKPGFMDVLKDIWNDPLNRAVRKEGSDEEYIAGRRRVLAWKFFAGFFMGFAAVTLGTTPAFQSAVTWFLKQSWMTRLMIAGGIVNVGTAVGDYVRKKAVESANTKDEEKRKSMLNGTFNFFKEYAADEHMSSMAATCLTAMSHA